MRYCFFSQMQRRQLLTESLPYRAWLQSIAQAARNSTISSSTNAFPSVNAAPHPNTRPGTPIEQYNISSSPTLAVKAQTSFLNFRSRGGDKEQTASRTRPSRCASPSIPKNSCKWTNPRKEKNEDGLETMIIGNPELVHPSTGDTVINNHLGQGARRVGLPAEAFG